jgi:hypothetical protein
MVRQHVLIGLGFKKQNFRNRALRYMMDKSIKGRGAQTMRPAVMPMPSSLPRLGQGTSHGKSASRRPLKFNY